MRFFKTLSGRFFLLSIVFVMLAEVMIFLPSIARFRQDYLLMRLERGQIAALVRLNDDEVLSPALEQELLDTAGIFNVVLRRDSMRELVLSSPVKSDVMQTYDMRGSSGFELIIDAITCLFRGGNQTVRVIGNPVHDAGLLIEVTIETAPLHKAMLDYGLRVFLLSAFISIITAFLLLIFVNQIIVKPIRRVIFSMKAYAEAPEDARRVIEPSSSIEELRTAEEALKSLQMQLSGTLKQKEHLAELGSAIAKISHDLRNLLTTAQLFSDRLENSNDPLVANVAPKLVKSISRAVRLCETTLTHGKADTPPPAFESVNFGNLIEGLIEEEGAHEECCILLHDIPPDITLNADPEYLHRILSNLVRNARQAIEATGRSDGKIVISLRDEGDHWRIGIADNGPGLPCKARENLFKAFQGGVRKGGIGLGLTIAAELAQAHGGGLILEQSSGEGTLFYLCLPK